MVQYFLYVSWKCKQSENPACSFTKSVHDTKRHLWFTECCVFPLGVKQQRHRCRSVKLLTLSSSKQFLQENKTIHEYILKILFQQHLIINNSVQKMFLNKVNELEIFPLINEDETKIWSSDSVESVSRPHLDPTDRMEPERRKYNDTSWKSCVCVCVCMSLKHLHEALMIRRFTHWSKSQLTCLLYDILKVSKTCLYCTKTHNVTHNVLD